MAQDNNEQQEHNNEQRELQRAQVPGATLLAAETLRHSALAREPDLIAQGKEPKVEDRWPLFWRIFGATMLSIAALVAITLYNQVISELHNLRNDLNQVNANHGDLARKDEVNSRIFEVNSRTTALLNSQKELQATNAASLAQRSALLEQQVKASEEERKEMARELQRLRDGLATLEGRSQSGPGRPAGVPSTKPLDRGPN
jgi:hypothetical protein